MTYGEATNLAVNQTLMRSINTTVIALLPVAGLLFIGAGLLGAGTLKDLGLVLFVGMLSGTYSSVFLAAPILVDLKNRDPRYRAHTARVLARRASGETTTRRRRGEAAAEADTAESPASGDKDKATDKADSDETTASGERVLAGSAPRPGARPTNRPAPRRRGGKGGGGRPGTKRRS
jgi:preprotein translocase subunit SecF